MRTTPAGVAVATGLALGLAATLGLGSTAVAAAEDRTGADSTTAARQALTTAHSVLSGTDGPSRDVTLTLRDLFEARASLTGADARAADSIRKRPTDPGDDDYYGLGATVETACSLVCVHWTESGEHAATPEYAADVLATMDEVHQAYAAAGYKAPLPDLGQGGNTMTDIYLAEISDYAYGYCTTDMPAYNPGDYAVYTYCVLDDDYAEFGNANTPTGFMQATAAHEYFHAVQGAYDWSEDDWLIESTATWAEDEVFDDVDDSLNYLPFGQLGGPLTPLDARQGFNIYGNWIWWRYLTEKYPAAQGGMPTLVRDVWRAADSTNGAANDRYSLPATRSVLAERGTSFKREYAHFAVENNTPRRTYEEGAENAYPSPDHAFKPIELKPSKRSTTRTVKLDHLTSGTGAYLPAGKSRQLKVWIDMTRTRNGSMAAIAVHRLDGIVTRHWVSLNKLGNGSRKVPFSKRTVKRVEVTLVNASDKMANCYSDPSGSYACSGFGRYDNQKQKVRVRAVR